VNKKLIEVALPLEAINRASMREKYIHHGHPSTLHLWWARRPLATCRALLFAQLVDDPSCHPERFPTEKEQENERQRLFSIIEELVEWENTDNEAILEKARVEILRSTRGQPPSILDPFCGGGSIPLEAQRLGLQAHASDLNPVAVLITKALIEVPPKFAGRLPVNPEARTRLVNGGWEGGAGLAEDVRYYGRWMRDEAMRRIGYLYPTVTVTREMAASRPDLRSLVDRQLTVIAWLWARTVASPNPALGGAPIPLVRSFNLSARKGHEAWVQPVVDEKTNAFRFEVRTGPGCPPDGTVNRRGATCLISGVPIPFEYIRNEGKAGRMGAKMMAIVADGPKGRIYLSPTKEHEAVAGQAKAENVPDTDLPERALSFRVQLYGC